MRLKLLVEVDLATIFYKILLISSSVPISHLNTIAGCHVPDLSVLKYWHAGENYFDQVKTRANNITTI
jgi:hypothetical protein